MEPRRKPEELQEKDNPFKDIREMPWWQVWLEMAGYLAALLVLVEAFLKVFIW